MTACPVLTLQLSTQHLSAASLFLPSLISRSKHFILWLRGILVGIAVVGPNYFVLLIGIGW